jgi:hypothetical protein
MTNLSPSLDDQPLPAIVIPTYARAHALERLLAGLSLAAIPPGVTLVFSVDPLPEGSGNARAVRRLADDFVWPQGEKRVIVHDRHLGLVGNIAFCGELSTEFGAIVLLEEDLVVAPQFYAFAVAALRCYGDDPRIAGISLNQQWFNGFTLQPFIPLPDAFDAYFLQLATPQGQVYTAAQWQRFADWWAEMPPRALEAVHDSFSRFPPSDWLAANASYLAETDRYYVYPRESLTTNFGDKGTHLRQQTAMFQVPLRLGHRDLCLGTLDASVAVYDAFFELLPDRLNRLTGALRDFDYDVDLYACKSARHLRAPFVLTTRRGRRPLKTFGRAQLPLEANVIDGVPGTGLTLYRREDVDTGRMAALAARQHNDLAFARGRRPSLLRRLFG